jgi:prephenate dehydrogenase
MSAAPGAEPIDRSGRIVGPVAVIGCGLVGGSVALALEALGVTVDVTDGDGDVRRRLHALGIGRAVHDDVASCVRDAEMVVVAVPPGAVPDVVAEAVRHASPSTVVTDVAGLKTSVVADVLARLTIEGLDPSRFVGGHPMAGSERSGPEAADATLFQGATWVLTPVIGTSDDALERVSALVGALGSQVLVLAPEQHDELVTVVSHLPQLVASLLTDVAADTAPDAVEALLAIAGPGFRDTTRVAASDPTMWTGLVGANAAAITDTLRRFRTALDALIAAVEDGDAASVTALLQRASIARRRLVPKGVTEDTVDVVVPVRDEPGALAEATRVLGAAGINIEDLTMRHASHADLGALIVRMRVSAFDRAVDALRAAGLSAHVESGTAGNVDA